MYINCRGQLLGFDRPKIMGILNITPDSFYDGGKYKSDSDMLKQAEEMLKHGADFIDIGGQSSRPKATHVSPEEESRRVVPVIQKLTENFPEALFSIDTFHSRVARSSVEAGAVMINDISAG